MTSAEDRPYRVMVVDDSAIVRGLVTRMLDADEEIEIVASVGNGELALAALDDAKPEVVVLDIEMPVMDGLTALPRMLEYDPTMRVIMASTLTRRNADISFEAMTLGAVDYVPKPSSAKEINVGRDFKVELVEKVKAWADQRRKMLDQEEAEREPEDDHVDALVDLEHGEGHEEVVGGELDLPPMGAHDHAGISDAAEPADDPAKARRVVKKRFSAELRPRPTPHQVPRPQPPMRPQPQRRPEPDREEAAVEPTPAVPTPAATPEPTPVVSEPAKRPRPAPAVKPRPAPRPSAPQPSARSTVGKRDTVKPAPRASGRPAAGPAKRKAPGASKEISLRPEPKFTPEVIAIGSSTGGPQALFAVLQQVMKTNLPIFITQHMPATFTTILAEHITRSSGFDCREGVDGEPVQPGRVYLAPGDYHMVVEGRGSEKVVRLNQDPPENFCRPSVDPMLRSLVKTYGGKVLTVILTGMGQDGLRGSEHVVDAGGAIVAQDEASSVVWGMPGAVATAGVCSAVLPLDSIGGYVNKHISRRGR